MARETDTPLFCSMRYELLGADEVIQFVQGGADGQPLLGDALLLAAPLPEPGAGVDGVDSSALVPNGMDGLASLRDGGKDPDYQPDPGWQDCVDTSTDRTLGWRYEAD